MDPFKINRKWNVSLQYGWDGIRREFSVTNVLFIIITVVLLGFFTLSLLYVMSIHDVKETQAGMTKLQKENRELRHKLDYYSNVIDSIYQKLDTLQVYNANTGQKLFSLNPYTNGLPPQDNTFVYDSFLDARVNSIEEQVRHISACLDVDNPINRAHGVESKDIVRLDNGPSIFPTFGRWSDGWGIRMHPILDKLCFHYGVDIANKMGTPVYATSDGEVISTGYDQEYGKLIRIKHAHDYETRYGHLYSFQVLPGDKVRKGQVIGTIGSTGMSTGPHLHYEVLVAGNKVNPANYLNRIDDAVYYAHR